MNNGSFKNFFKVGLLASASVLSYVAHAELVVSSITPPTSMPANQIPSDESIEKLMIVQQFDKSIEVQNQQMIDNLKKSTANILKSSASSPEKTAKAQKIINDFVADSLKELNSPTIKAQYKANYMSATKAIYNQQEVNAMIDFSSSPIGQQIVKKQDDFSGNLMQRDFVIMQHWQEDLMKNKMPKLFSELIKLKDIPKTK